MSFSVLFISLIAPERDVQVLFPSHTLKNILPPSLGRDRIVAVTAEGMAPQQPPGSKNQPLQGAMNTQGLNHVVRTTRLKSTTPTEERTQYDLIGPNKQNQQTAHLLIAQRISFSTSAHDLPPMPQRAMKIHSAFSGAVPSLTSKRYASRNNRFARLRSTAS